MAAHGVDAVRTSSRMLGSRSWLVSRLRSSLRYPRQVSRTSRTGRADRARACTSVVTIRPAASAHRGGGRHRSRRREPRRDRRGGRPARATSSRTTRCCCSVTTRTRAAIRSSLPRTVFGPFGAVSRRGHAVARGVGQPRRARWPRRRAARRARDRRGGGGQRQFGDLLLVGLDSNPPVPAAQLEFLERTLCHDARALAVSSRSHHPPYSAGYQGSHRPDARSCSRRCSRGTSRRRASAHDHDYQRSGPIDGVTYIVTGGAARGSLHRHARRSPPSSYRVRHFVEVAVLADRLVVRGIDHHGPRVRRSRRRGSAPSDVMRGAGVTRLVASAAVIKYLGSKRRLVPVLGEICAAVGAGRALDLFTGTTRVAQEFKRQRCAHDGGRQRAVRLRVRATATSRSTATTSIAASSRPRSRDLAGRPRATTATSPRRSAGSRGSSSRTTAAASTRSATRSSRTTGDSWMYPVLLTSLIEAADRVDSTTGVQMAYVKQWATRSHKDLELRDARAARRPGRERCPATRAHVAGDARAVRPRVPRPAVQPAPLLHELPHLGDARRVGRARALRRRVQARRRARADDEERVQRPPPHARCARATSIAAVDARLVVVSYNDEAWVSVDELEAMAAARGGAVRTLAFDSKRYVGAQIGIHNPQGEKVGEVSPPAQRRVPRVRRRAGTGRASNGSAGRQVDHAMRDTAGREGVHAGVPVVDQGVQVSGAWMGPLRTV